MTHLMRHPPAHKFDVVLECVGFVDQSLYLNSKSYLAPTGIFVSLGPMPHGISDVLKLARLAFELMRPKWLGGIQARWA